MQTWVKAAIAAGSAAAAFGLFSWFSGSAKAAPSSADAAKKGQADGCAAGTADGKAGTENLNATDPSTNSALAAAAKASGDSVAYLAAFSKNYDSCFAANSKKAPTPGTATTHVATDCTNYKTWPSDVQAAWTEYETHKGDGATSAYATSGKASTLYGKFLKLGCAGNAATVQATIQSWIDAGGTVTGGPDCKDLSTWPKSLADTYKLYTSDPRAFVDGGANNGPALVKALAAIGCPGTAAAVQHTYDLELAAGNIPGASTSGVAGVGQTMARVTKKSGSYVGTYVGAAISSCATGLCAMTGAMGARRREPKQLQKPIRVGWFGRGGINYGNGKASSEVDSDLVYRSF